MAPKAEKFTKSQKAQNTSTNQDLQSRPERTGLRGRPSIYYKDAKTGKRIYPLGVPKQPYNSQNRKRAAAEPPKKSAKKSERKSPERTSSVDADLQKEPSQVYVCLPQEIIYNAAESASSAGERSVEEMWEQLEWSLTPEMPIKVPQGAIHDEAGSVFAATQQSMEKVWEKPLWFPIPDTQVQVNMAQDFIYNEAGSASTAMQQSVEVPSEQPGQPPTPDIIPIADDNVPITVDNIFLDTLDERFYKPGSDEFWAIAYSREPKGRTPRDGPRWTMQQSHVTEAAGLMRKMRPHFCEWIEKQWWPEELKRQADENVQKMLDEAWGDRSTDYMMMERNPLWSPLDNQFGF